MAAMGSRGRTPLMALHGSISEFYDQHLSELDDAFTDGTTSLAGTVFYSRRYTAAVADFLGYGLQSRVPTTLPPDVSATV